MTMVIDASVAAKWYLDEAGSEEARAIAMGSGPLLAPDLITPEVATTLWRKARMGQIGAAVLTALPLHLPRAFRALVPSIGLLDLAIEIAVAYDHPVYDCLYVALARKSEAPLVTADGRLVRRFASGPDSHRVIALTPATTASDPSR